MRELYLINEDIDRYRAVGAIRNNRDWYADIARLRGQALPADFGPIDIEWIPDTVDAEIGDFPYFSPNLICISHRATEILFTLLKESGEFIPLTGLDYVAFYPLKIIDCVDQERSNRLLEIEERFSYHSRRFTPVLKQELAEADVFRTPESISKFFVSSEFKDICAEHGLSGLEFIPVPLL